MHYQIQKLKKLLSLVTQFYLPSLTTKVFPVPGTPLTYMNLDFSLRNNYITHITSKQASIIIDQNNGF